MAICVSAESCTQCGQPQTICPTFSSARSSACTLGKQDDVAVGDELFAGGDSADEFGQCVVGGAEIRAVAVLEEDPRTNARIDPGEMCTGESAVSLVLLTGASQDA